MVASLSTVEHLYALIVKFVPAENRMVLLQELVAIDGNKLFKDTMKRLLELHLLHQV